MNARKYNKKISIEQVIRTTDQDGFNAETEKVILSTWAEVKTTSGITLIKNNTDFEKANTRFVIRYPKQSIERGVFIRYNGKRYKIEYINNIDEDGKELELQAVAVTK